MIQEIKIDNEQNSVDIKLRGSTVVIRGASATGKSLLVGAIKRQIAKLKARKNGFDALYSNIVIFDYQNEKISDIRNCVGKLIILDNADELLSDASDIVEFINNDIDNQYIVIGRTIKGLNVTPNYIGHINIEQGETRNIITIEYDFTEGSWW